MHDMNDSQIFTGPFTITCQTLLFCPVYHVRVEQRYAYCVVDCRILKGQGHFHFQRALPLKNLKVNGKFLKGHQGHDQGQQRPRPECNSRPGRVGFEFTTCY